GNDRTRSQPSRSGEGSAAKATPSPSPVTRSPGWLQLLLITVNKQERTYTILRDRIHSGSFAPLERLNIDALARELGVSPIPVREALRRLEAEGWVRFTPNVGAVVSPVDSTSWEQAMVALAILEGAASAEAQQHLRRSDLTRLRKIAAG